MGKGASCAVPTISLNDVSSLVGTLRFAHPTANTQYSRAARCLYLFPGSEITRLATSLFQMNSTNSAPIVAVMKPAP